MNRLSVVLLLAALVAWTVPSTASAEPLPKAEPEVILRPPVDASDGAGAAPKSSTPSDDGVRPSISKTTQAPATADEKPIEEDSKAPSKSIEQNPVHVTPLLIEWPGAYEAVSQKSAHIKKMLIVKEQDGSLKIRAWMLLEKGVGVSNLFEYCIETKAVSYSECDSKKLPDRLIASFSAASCKPIVVLTQGAVNASQSSPESIVGQNQGLTYTCYLHGYQGDCYVCGILEKKIEENKAQK